MPAPLSQPNHTVLHGSNLSQLYQFANQIIDQARQKNATIHHFQANQDDLSQLRDELGTQSIFGQLGQQRCWQITHFESLRSPKKKKELVQLLDNTANQVLLTIPKELTKTQLKLFEPGQWQIKQFKLPAVFFALTDAIKVKSHQQTHQLLQQSLQQKNDWELHALLTRQFRLLLASKNDAPVKAPPFAISKLKNQANQFTTNQLIKILHELFRIEYEHKSGRAHLLWSGEIDRLLAKIYHEQY